MHKVGGVPLNLIHGPPNSGRAGLIRRRFTAALGRDPVLVVPNTDDVFAFEQELCEAEGALLGGSVLIFEGLFEAVARATGAVPLPRAGAAQRLRLIRLAVERAAPRLLARSAGRPGFVPAIETLIEELEGAMLDPIAFEEAATGLEESAYLGELASIYRAHSEVRDSRRLSDPHVVARAAIEGLRREPMRWGERPVFLYAIDDLTREQLALVAGLASTTEVTVALTYEERPALAARRDLLNRLRELGVESEEATAADPANTESELLFHLERSFLEREPEAAAAPDGSLTLLRAAGERGEAEVIGAEIVRLLAAGEHPRDVAVALRDPDRRGPLFRHVLESHGVPVATEAKIPASGTATGGALLALLRAAFTSREAGDLLAYLRGPRRARRDDVDWLERAMLRGRLQSAEEAAAEFERIAGRELTPLRRLLDAAGEPRRLLFETANLARDIAEWPLAEEGLKGEIPPAPEAEELRVSATIAATLEELRELEGIEPSPVELIEIIEGLRMPLWQGPAGDRVRIASPYRLRAGRFRHLFVASLQDGEFPRRDGGSPFLSDRQRTRLGLPERAETEAEERYLFYSCLSLPTAGLWLSCRVSDEDGGAEQPSPLLGEVRRLLDPPPEPGQPDPLDAELVRTRGLGDVSFRRTAASSVQLAAAAKREQRTRAPGPLKAPAVLEALAERTEYGGTTLETFAVCSYRWFADHELCPEPLGPKPEGLTQGSLMHETLERLYRARPGGDPLPRPASLREWERLGAEIVAEEAERVELSRTHPADRAMRCRVERLLVAFLRREAAREAPALEPAMLEAGFGEGEGSERPGLDLGGWLLHGRIDRIDTDGAGAGLVQDYKLSTKVAPWAAFEDEGRLQLPLYAIALRELWETEPLGALYQPLRATRDLRPRGLARATASEELADLRPVGRDLLDDEEFEAQLVGARERASRIVERMRGGEIDRDPIGDRCPDWCGYAPICRRERGAPGERDEEPAETEGQR